MKVVRLRVQGSRRISDWALLETAPRQRLALGFCADWIWTDEPALGDDGDELRCVREVGRRRTG